MRKLLTLLILTTILLQTSCLVVQNPHTGLAPGRWRGVLKLSQSAVVPPEESQFAEMNFEEVLEGELPFLFDVVYEDENNFHLEIINGKIWIQKDQTEEGIATYLEEAGIPKDAIVLGFHSLDVRPFTEYAAA